MSELLTKTALELVDLLASGQVSSVEVTQAHLDQIAAVDADVRAFLHVDTERALATAARVDERRAAGDQLGALAGVPVAVKDLLCYEGAPTTAGSRILEGFVPPYSSTVVRKLSHRKLYSLQT